MEEVPLPMPLTKKEEIKESFKISQEEKNFKLNIEIINQEIILNVLDEKDLMKEYEIKLTFDELKKKNKIFLTFSSCQDFIDFIKATIENKKILFKKNKENQMTIEFMVEYLFKQNTIKFDLNKKKINLELCAQDLYQKFANISEICKNLEMNYNKVIEENKGLKENITNLKNDNKILKNENKNLINRINIIEFKMNSSNNMFNYSMNNNNNNFNSFNMINNNFNERMNNNENDEDEFFLSFEVGENKELFLDFSSEITFAQIKDELIKKYDWLKDLNIKGFEYDELEIPLNSNCARNGIEKGAKIKLILQKFIN